MRLYLEALFEGVIACHAGVEFGKTSQNSLAVWCVIVWGSWRATGIEFIEDPTCICFHLVILSSSTRITSLAWYLLYLFRVLAQMSLIVFRHGSMASLVGMGSGCFTARRVSLVGGVRVRLTNDVILLGACQRSTWRRIHSTNALSMHLLSDSKMLDTVKNSSSSILPP
jgi:hypothetical protein